MKEKLTISRLWDNPKITTTITDKSISLQMDIDDFVNALKQELGGVTWVFTQKEFEKRLDTSISKILNGIKQESTKVV